MAKINHRNLNLNFSSPVNVLRRGTLKRLVRHFNKLAEQYPDICEGVITIDGVEHWFTCVGNRGDHIEVQLLERNYAEQILNEQGLSTVEPWSPWPAEHKH